MKRHHLLPLAGLLALLAPAEAQEIGKQAFALVESQAPRIVTLKVVLNVEVRGNNQELRLTARGVLVSATGLVLTATEVFSPNIRINDRPVEAKVTPSDVKVILGNEEKEHEAFQSGKDTKLGLAFVQISDLADKKLPFVDFGASVSAVPGSDLVTINRLDKGFDFAPYFSLGTITGELKKPRPALLIDRPNGIGLPAFTLKGQVVGVHARLESSIVEGNRPQVQQCILPGKVVAGVIRSAAKQADELLADLKAGKKPELPGDEEEKTAPEDEPLPGDEKKK